MKFGLFAINMGWCSDPVTAVRVAQAAEAAGFESVWTGGAHRPAGPGPAGAGLARAARHRPLRLERCPLHVRATLFDPQQRLVRNCTVPDALQTRSLLSPRL